MADGTIKIDIRGDSSKLGGDIARSANKVKSLTNEFNNQVKVLRDLENETKKTQESLDKMKVDPSKLASIKQMEADLKAVNAATVAIEKENANLEASYQKAVEQLEQLKETGFNTEQLTPYINEVDRLAQQLAPIDEKLESNRQRATEMAQAIAQIKMDPSTAPEVQELEQRLQALSGATTETKQRMDQISGDMKFARIGEAARDAGQKIISMGQSAISGLGKIISAAGRAASSIFSIGKNSNSAAGGIQKMAVRIGSMIKNAFVFNVISKALRGFRNTLNSVAMSVPQISTAVSGIGQNMWTAFAPIWEAIQPALLTFLGVVQRVTQAVATLIAMLFGKTYQQASASAQAIQANADALDNQAASTGSAGKAAKDASKELAAFDKINQQSADTASGGGGGGGGGGGAGGTFADMEVPSSALLDWIEELKNKLLELEPDLEYFRNLGFKFGQAIADWLDNIPWDTIQAWARSFAMKLAAFLDGALVQSTLLPSLGTTIAQALNTALIFVFNFIRTFPFYQFGVRIGEGLNNAVNTIDWALLGATLAGWIMSIINTAYGIVTTFNWEEFGNSIGESINSFFRDIEWDTIAKTFSEAIKGVLNTMSSAISEINWKQIGTDIKTFLVNMDWDGIWKAIKDAISAAFSGFRDLLVGIFGSEEAADVFVGILTALATVIGVISAAMAIYNVATAIAAIVTNALFLPVLLVVAAIVALVAIIWLLIENWDSVAKAAQDAWDWIVGVFVDAATWFDENVIQPIFGFFQGLWDTVTDIFSGVAEFFGFGSDAADEYKDGMSGSLETAEEDVIEPFLEDTKASLDPMEDIGTQSGSKLKDGISGELEDSADETYGTFLGDTQKTLNLEDIGTQSGAKLTEGITTSLDGSADSTYASFLSDTEKTLNLDDIGLQSGSDLTSGLTTSLDGAAASTFQPLLSDTEETLDLESIGMSSGQGFTTGLTNSLSGVAETTFQPFIDEVNGLLGTGTGHSIVFEGIGNEIVEGLKTGLAPITSSAGNVFVEMVTTIKNSFSGIGVFFSDIFKVAWINIKAPFASTATFFSQVNSRIKNAFSTTKTFFSNTFKLSWQAIEKAFSTVKTFFSRTWLNITDAFKTAGTWFRTTFGVVWKNIEASFSTSKTFFTSVWENIKNTFSVVPKWFETTFTDAWTRVKNVFSTGGAIFVGIQDGIVNGLKTVVNGIINGMNAVLYTPFNALNRALNTIRSANVAGKYPFAGLPYISIPQIPRLKVGLDYVPYDEFPALLHEGERVLTAEENKAYTASLGSGISAGTMAQLNNFSVSPQATAAIAATGSTSDGNLIAEFKAMREEMRSLVNQMASVAVSNSGGGNVVINSDSTMGQLIRLLRFELVKEDNRAGFRIQPQRVT